MKTFGIILGVIIVGGLIYWGYTYFNKNNKSSNLIERSPCLAASGIAEVLQGTVINGVCQPNN